ncbi:uncharacterized protein LOC128733427 isoform X2 [Sabethes cyaneus]|uniref:uncharacterized protein LOC128733427 isoform X2 n=1 Tax=Sabethes cyaneus TaxID=53552 RepID=UPI00237E7D7F|nr:uncharacterized protein LOC128733427 isoform X2 [Sabethes cyaneus]
MELSRLKVLCTGLVLQLLFTIALPLPYNKYGRQCTDIGCLSSQVCVMAYDSCSLGQRENNECGRYPTCKKKTEAGLAADNTNDLYSNKPAPPKTAPPTGDDDVLSSLGLNPDMPSNNRPGAVHPNPSPSAPNPYGNPYPALPPSQPKPTAPYYPPGGSNNNYYGGGGGAGGAGGNAGNRRPGQFDGSTGNIVVPTQKPTGSSSGGGFFGSILGGIQNAVSNAVKQQVGTYINQRLGIGPAAGQAGGAGGLGGLFDARNFINSKSSGSLFSERKPAGSDTSSSGPYPVTVDQRSQVYGANPQPYRGSSSEINARQQNTRGTPAPYGWKLD